MNLTTTKITERTLRLLKIISALTGEKQYEALERILVEELARMKKENKLILEVKP